MKRGFGSRLDFSLIAFSIIAILDAMVRSLFFSGVLHPQWLNRMMTTPSLWHSLYSFVLFFGPSMWRGWREPFIKVRHSFTKGARAALWMGVLLNLLEMLTLLFQVGSGHIEHRTAMVVILLSWVVLPIGVFLGGTLAVITRKGRAWLVY